jgi:acetyl-CoA carboxylase biotin carboxyl carrier protein
MADTVTVEAPMPGVFYRRPDPDEPVFAEEGDEVAAGDKVALIGVM